MIRSLLTSLLILLLIQNCISTCDFTINQTQINKLGQLDLLFENNTTKNICFNLLKPENTQKPYCLRIDFLSKHCISGTYDHYLTYNGQKYVVEVPLTRSCKKLTLKQGEEQLVSLAYEFRSGYKSGGLVLYDSMVEWYLPTIVVLIIFSLYWQKKVFGEAQLQLKTKHE